MAWTFHDNTFTNADRLTSAWLRYWEPFTNRLTSSARQLDKCQLFSVDAHFCYLLRHSRKMAASWRQSISVSCVRSLRPLGSRTMLMVEGQARRCRLLDGDVTFVSWFLFIRLNHTRPRYESLYLPICLGVVYTRTSRVNTPSFTIV